MSSNAADGGAAARPSGAREVWSAAAFYGVLAVAMTWPLLPRMASHLGALEGPGDPYLELWVLGWDLHTLTTSPADLFTLRIFDANIFHPARGTLAYSDHLILQALALLPVYWITGDPVVCYNVLLLVSLVASGLAMYVYAREVSGSRAGALVAGVAWGFWPYRVAHLLHIQLQSLYFLPLTLLYLHRTVIGRRGRDAIWLGVFAGLQAVCSLNYGVITAVALVTGALVLVAGVGRWRSLRLGRRLLAAALVGVLLAAPFTWPYWRAQREEGFVRSLFEASQHQAVLSSYLQVPPVNAVYGRTRLLTARDAVDRLRPGHRESVERELFPGLVLVILAVAGAWTGARRGNWPVVAAMLAIGTVGFVLSLGPGGVRPLYAAAYHYVFGFQGLRAPARFAVLVACALSVLAAAGIAALADRRRHAHLFTAAAAALMVVEYWSAPLPYVPRPPRETAVGQWLAAADGPGAVVHLPLTHDRQNTLAMVQSMEHWRPVVNGHSGQRPFFFPALVDALSSFPGAEALWTLKDFDVRFVVTPTAVNAGDRSWESGAATPLVERARLPDGVIYELVWTGEIEARLPRTAAPAPPPPGAVPFVPGERAAYDVAWVGGPVGVPAGRATILVESAGAGGYRFVARAATAAWVRRFFEARDEFATVATADLLPIEHRREQKHGRREVSRVFTFDRLAGVVRISRGGEWAGPEVVLSVPPGARDALTAFYYLRTLPLAAGETVRVPINDGGRNLVLELPPGRVERIAAGGRHVDALRLEPRLVQRVARRAPLRIVAWLSREDHRMPLAAEIEGSFGRLRLALVEYRAR